MIEDCLTEAIRYAKERHQHGKAIAKHQLVQEHLAAIEMHRLATRGAGDAAPPRRRKRAATDPATMPI